MGADPSPTSRGPLTLTSCRTPVRPVPGRRTDQLWPESGPGCLNWWGSTLEPAWGSPRGPLPCRALWARYQDRGTDKGGSSRPPVGSLPGPSTASALETAPSGPLWVLVGLLPKPLAWGTRMWTLPGPCSPSLPPPPNPSRRNLPCQPHAPSHHPPPPSSTLQLAWVPLPHPEPQAVTSGLPLSPICLRGFPLGVATVWGPSLVVTLLVYICLVKTRRPNGVSIC